MNVGTKLLLASIAIALVLVAAWRVHAPPAKKLPTPEYTGTSVHRPDKVLVDSASTPPAAAERTAIAGEQSSKPVLDNAPSETRATDEVAQVRVLVLDQRAGTPLGRAYVVAQCSDDVDMRLWWNPPIPSPSCEPRITDADGRVEIDVPAGRDLEIRAGVDLDWISSKYTTVHALARGESREVTLRIPSDRDLDFWCRFVDEATHAPIAGVSVVRVSGAESGTRVGTSDERGLAHVIARDWRKKSYAATSPGRGVVYVCPESEHESAETALVVPLTPSASLHLRIVDGEQKPMVGVEIEIGAKDTSCAWNGIHAAALQSIPYPHWNQITDHDGRVSFPELPARIALEARLNEKISENQVGATLPRRRLISLAPGESRAFEWQVYGSCDVTGRVVDGAGIPVAYRDIWLVPRPLPDPTRFGLETYPEFSITTDIEGRFEFAHVRAGKWAVGTSPMHEAEGQPPGMVPAALAFDIGEEMTTTFVEVRVDGGLAIHGAVLDSRGSPTRGAFVTANNLDHTPIAFTHTEENGSFSLGELTAGTFEIFANANAGRDCPSEPLRIEAGANNVLLRLRKGASISGRVVDAKGAGAVAQLAIRRIDADGADAVRSNPTVLDFECLATDAEGDFHTAQLEPGTYDIAASRPDLRSGVLRHLQLSAGSETDDLIVRLEAGGQVRIRAAHGTGSARFKLYTNGVLIDAWEAQPGTYRKSSVPAGRASVQVELDNGHVKYERSIDVAVGETVELSLGDEAR